MNFRLFAFRILLGCILCVKVNAQDTLDVGSKFVFDYVNDHHKFKKELDLVIRNFGGPETYRTSKADEIIDLFIKRSELIPESMRFRFFRVKYDCFTVKQRSKIKAYLIEKLDHGDESYYHLISMYKLDAFKAKLKRNLNYEGDLIDLVARDNKIRQLSDRNKTILNSMATLASLGDLEMEDHLIQLVKDAYLSQFKDNVIIVNESNQNSLLNLYNDVVRNTIGMITSVKSVRETLYLLDELSEFNYFATSPCSGTRGYGNMYLVNNVSEKILYSSNIHIIGFKNIDTEKVKDKLMNRDDIWQDFVRK